MKECKDAYAKLHPLIQRQIYRMGWEELRPIQCETIHAIRDTPNHIIISASTASGKTEAAFLPILSEIVDDHQGSIKAIYVGPLKALINDQFRRLEELCNFTEIPVYKWHADASQAGKRKVKAKPGGILLITPESIESLFINHSSRLKTMFLTLSYIVIDEMHSFIGNERGIHLKSLLTRLLPLSQKPVRLIGLSATLGDDELAKKWLSPNEPEFVSLIKGKKGDKSVKCQIKGYTFKNKFCVAENDSTQEQEIKAPEEAKLAYRQLTKKYHPDFAQDPEERAKFTEFMKQINRAYHGSDFKELKRLLVQLDPESMERIDILAEHVQKFEDASEDDYVIALDIIRLFYQKTALIFANRRQEIEQYADIVSRILEHQKRPNTFRVHHGSLSKIEREDTEEALKSTIKTTAFCSSTLEMGIDVGNVELVGQIGPAWSVNSLFQRLGRSGRRAGELSNLYMLVAEQDIQRKSDIVSRIYPNLLQSIALIELIVEDWYEPPDIGRLHLSTLIQQIMSLLKESGGERADTVFKVLAIDGAFRNIDKFLFISVLRSMKAFDLIDQAPDGDLILGLEGEVITKKIEFYAAFTTAVVYKVLHKGRLIGTVDNLPGSSDSKRQKSLILAGKRWKVLDVDHEKLEVYVDPSEVGVVPKFGGDCTLNVHPKIREKMFEILKDTSIPNYLDQTAQEMLKTARAAAVEAELLVSPFVVNGSKVIWFTWTGSKIHRTLWGLARLTDKLNIEGTDGPYCDLTLSFENTLDEVIETLPKLMQNPPSLEEIARVFPRQGIEKYDRYLSDNLQTLLFANNLLDFNGSMNLIERANIPSLVLG